jgi:protein involved in polysaccharide export with SLBB domain
VLERKGTERSQFFRVNLKEVYAGEGPVDMPILNDDVLYVPIRRFEVFVLGEVEVPGSQSYRPSTTVGQYIALAGGTTSAGSWSKLRVIDSEGNERKVKRTDNLHRGDVLFVGKSNFSIFSDVLLTAVSLSAIILAINALAQ